MLSQILYVAHTQLSSVFAVICKSQLFPLLISTDVELVFAGEACDLFLLLLLWSEL